jgi:L-lactate dehydrogenase complex protein LldG
MSSQSQAARQRIMARLKTSGCHQLNVPQAPTPPTVRLDRDAKIERLTSLMTAIRTEVHEVAADGWVEALMALARERQWNTLLYGPEGPIGDALDTAWSAESADLPELIAYNEPVETFKERLFQIDAGITSVRSAVADTGAIVLWPTPQEPRLLSLVPPVHVAVMDADTIHNSMSEMMAVENWAGGMPTNALLISGPSKTADIEFTLVFGVHGPKELILLIRK